MHALEETERKAVRAIVDAAMDGRREPFWLDAAATEALLGAAGIAVAPSRLVSPGAAVPAAEEMGYPLVAKAIDGVQILNKIEVVADEE